MYVGLMLCVVQIPAGVCSVSNRQLPANPATMRKKLHANHVVQTTKDTVTTLHQQPEILAVAGDGGVKEYHATLNGEGYAQ